MNNLGQKHWHDIYRNSIKRPTYEGGKRNSNIKKSDFTKPLVSVIMVAYNSEKTILDAVYSVLNQTLRSFELIIVDDCSTDLTSKLVLSVNDPRVRLVQLSKNIGPGAARNLAVNLATSPFLAIMDADDVAFPERLELQLNVFNKDTSLDIVSGQVVEFDDELVFRAVDRSTDTKVIEKKLAKLRMPIAHCSAMFRKTSVMRAGGYDEQARRAQDFALILKMNNPRVAVLDAPLVFYRFPRPPTLKYILASDRHGRIVRKKARRNDWSPTNQRIGLPNSVFSDLKSLIRWSSGKFLHTMRRTFNSWLGKATVLTFARISGALVSALIYLQVARELIPSEFGLISVWIGVISWVGVIFDFGLSTYINKALSIHGNHRSALVALRLQRASTIIFAGVGIGLVLLFAGATPHVIAALVMIVFWTSFEKLLETEAIFYFAESRVATPALNLIIRRLLALILFPLLHLFMPVELALGASLITSGAIGYLLIRRRTPSRNFNLNEKFALDLTIFRKSIGYSISSMSVQSRDLESLSIAISGGLYAAGTYSAFSRMTNPLFLLTSPISSLIFTQVGEKGNTWAFSTVRKISITILLLALLMLLALPISSTLVELTLGSVYSTQSPAFVIIASATIIYAGRIPLNTILQAAGKEKYVTVNSLLRAFILLLGLALGAHFGGALGASMCYLGIMAVDLGVLNLQLRKMWPDPRTVVEKGERQW